MSSVPIIPGFYPDPSLCRVGDDYYLATSSFEYAPAVPLFTSRDLMTWRQVGNVLDRPSQFIGRPGPRGASTGIYAPTIRHHDGLFWMITTNREKLVRGHLIVHAENPEGPWSEPVFTTGITGIDPDIVWDGAGHAWVAWADAMTGGISIVEIDPFTGQLQGEPALLWGGTGLAHPEGPHLFQRDGWWYLVIAEGGTHLGHAVTVARSRALAGPYESAPQNPILSHRSTNHPVQATGHADIVELADGTWAMVHLGIRQRGDSPGWHVNGRETFIVGIEWEDGWPVVVEDRFELAESPVGPDARTAFVDLFTAPTLDPRWIAPGAHPATFAATSHDGLALQAGRGATAREAVHLLGVRARDDSWQAIAEVSDGDAAMVVRIDDQNWAAVERRAGALHARVVIGPLDQILASHAPVPPGARLAIRAEQVPNRIGVRGGPDTIRLGYHDGDGFHEMVEIDGRYLSTEVAGGYTGRVVGVEALDGPATVRMFAYEPIENPQVDDPYATMAESFGVAQ